jgi:hypothetical protein
VHLSFAVVVRRNAAARGLLPRFEVVQRYLVPITLERALFVALLIGLFGLGACCGVLRSGRIVSFGPLKYDVMIRVLTVSLTSNPLALQLVAIIDIEI